MYYGARYYDPAAGRFISPDTLIPDPGNVLDYNRYLYARGNPLKYNDPSGHWVESALDIAFIGYDLYDIQQNGWSWGNSLALAADIGGLLLPVVTGGGLAVHAMVHADDAAGSLKAVDKAADAVETVTEAQNAFETVKVAGEAAYQTARAFNYRGVFFASNPALRQYSDKIVVHHSVPLEVLKKHPNLFTPEELNAAANLRGIPQELNNNIHLSQVHGQQWEQFWRDVPQPTRDQILDFAKALDEKFALPNLAGDYFTSGK